MDTLKRNAMTILWPAFLMAGLLEILVFAMVDPGELHGIGGSPLALSAEALYTLTFLVFWIAISVSGIISSMLSASADEVNAQMDPR